MAAITAFFESIFAKILTFFIGLIVALPVPTHIYDAPKGETYDVKVVSYNVYVAGAGESSPENRTELVVKTIRSEMPDSFGLQEADWGWVSRISEAMPEYAWVGVGRDDGEQGGEFSPVFYLKDKYNLIDSGTFWLSKTPEKPSRGWDAMMKRICGSLKKRCLQMKSSVRPEAQGSAAGSRPESSKRTSQQTESGKEAA